MDSKRLLIGLSGLLFNLEVLAGLDLTSTVNCTYQRGQILDETTAKNVNNTTPLNWTFNGLKSSEPIFVSGGDSGKVFSIPMDNGVIIYLPHASGTSVFTIWNTGKSFWNKQLNSFNDIVYSQQILGQCEN